MLSLNLIPSFSFEPRFRAHRLLQKKQTLVVLGLFVSTAKRLRLGFYSFVSGKAR